MMVADRMRESVATVKKGRQPMPVWRPALVVLDAHLRFTPVNRPLRASASRDSTSRNDPIHQNPIEAIEKLFSLGKGLGLDPEL